MGSTFFCDGWQRDDQWGAAVVNSHGDLVASDRADCPNKFWDVASAEAWALLLAVRAVCDSVWTNRPYRYIVTDRTATVVTMAQGTA